MRFSDFKAGQRDCKCGVFDKWYRYNHSDNGRSYELGWFNQNKIVQNENVTFIG